MKYFHQKINYMSTECSLKMGRSNPGTGSYETHWHNSIEMIYGFENEYSVTAGQKKFHLCKRDILFIPCRVLHSFHMENQTSRLYFLQFKLSPVYFGGDIDRTKKQKDTFNPIMEQVTIINHEDNPELHPCLVQTVEELIHTMERCQNGYRYHAISKLYEILALLTQFPAASSYYSDHMNTDELETLTKTLAFIEDNFNKHITIDDAAKQCGFNTKYFGRIFNKITGSYFNDFLNDFRIKKATELLQQNPVSVSDVAYSCGFTSIPTFYRYFNKTYNCSPKEFISKYRI